METSKLYDKLQSIESDLPVENIIFNNFYLWPILKILIYNENWSKLNIQQMKLNNSILQRISILFFSLINFILFILKRQNKFDSIAICHSVDKKIKLNSIYYDNVMYPVINYLKSNGYSPIEIEIVTKNTFFTKNKKASISAYPIQFASSVFRVFLPFNLKNLFDLKQISSLKNACIKNGLSVEILDEKNISKYLKQLYFQKLMFLVVLKFFKTKLVVQPCWYSFESLALRMATKELGIKYIDYQHGVHGERHIAYTGWIKKNINALNIFPDEFWVWDLQESNEFLQSVSVMNSIISETGNLFYKAINNKEIILSESIELNNFISSNKFELKILLSLQPGLEFHESIMDQLSLFNPKCLLFIRLHPLQIGLLESIKQFYMKRFPNLNFDFVFANTLSLPTILDTIDLHFTFNSSVVIDAYFFNKKSIILDVTDGNALFKRYISINKATLGPLEIIKLQFFINN